MTTRKNNTPGNQPSYRKGSFKLRENNRGGLVLEPGTLEDAESYSLHHDDVQLDISGLSLSEPSSNQQNNPYDSVPVDKSAGHWGKGFIR